MTTKHTRGRPPHPDILTPAEWKIVQGVRHGLSNPDLADKQGVSLNAVKFHVANILAKLSLRNRGELRLWDGIEADSALLEQPSIDKTVDLSVRLTPRISQIARTVKDVDAAADWFRDILGLTPLFSFPQMAFLECHGLRLYLTEGDPGANSILYFNVPDIRSAHQSLIEKSVEILSAPHMIHRHANGTEEWMAFFRDLEGQPLAIMSQISPSSQDNEIAEPSSS